MKVLVAALAVFVATPVFAHVEVGAYNGKTADGQDCSFEVKGVNFTYGIRHPLNERVEIELGHVVYVLQHLPRVDLSTEEVLFDREQLTGAMGVQGAANALVLKMNHTDGVVSRLRRDALSQEGPESLTIVTQDYRYGSRKKSVCGDLTFSANK